MNLNDCGCYELPQGKIYIGRSDNKLSVGYLELEPHTELDRHSRPVDEELTQIDGVSVIVLDDKEIILRKGEKLIIPANVKHIHENRSDEKSLTFWSFEGDITNIINKIRNKYSRR